MINNIIDQAVEITNLPESIPVLLVGETGTGKSRAAQLIHEKSSRKNRPFITVECGGLAPTLLKSTLFGHKKGSFTDAKYDQPGKFEIVRDGIIFLDEVDCIPLDLQSYLLRVIDRGDYEAIGSNKTQQFTGRIIAATNRNLSNPDIFRSDLYFRLNTFEFQIPPLRETPEQICTLAKIFADEFAQQFERPMFKLTQEDFNILQMHTWPGNIRELRSCIQRLVVTLDDIKYQNYPEPVCVPTKSESKLNSRLKPLDRVRYMATRAYIIKVLTRCGGNCTKAAKELQISRVALYKAIKTHNIKKDTLCKYP